jgi:hypothetical protein
MRTIVLVASLVAILAGAAPAGADVQGSGEPDMVYYEPEGVDGCGSAPVEVGDPNYDGACDPAESVDIGGTFYRTLEGVVLGCRVIEEKITYRAKIARNKIWEYVQQVEWCWNGVTIRAIDRIRFPRLGWAGSVFWDFKGHVASSCAGTSDYSPCSERAGRSTAYIATQGKFQTITCGAVIFPCVTKVPGMWVKINAAGRVQGYGSL